MLLMTIIVIFRNSWPRSCLFCLPPQLCSLEHLAMSRQDIHLSLRRSMIFVVFQMFPLFLLLFHWPQYFSIQLGWKWWNLGFWHEVRWCAIFSFIMLPITSTYWRLLIHVMVNCWWLVHKKLIWMKWECRILKIYHIWIWIILWVW